MDNYRKLIEKCCKFVWTDAPEMAGMIQDEIQEASLPVFEEFCENIVQNTF